MCLKTFIVKKKNTNLTEYNKNTPDAYEQYCNAECNRLLWPLAWPSLGKKSLDHVLLISFCTVPFLGFLPFGFTAGLETLMSFLAWRSRFRMLQIGLSTTD